MHFSELGLSTVILRALEQEGYSTPTPVQREAIPHVLAGRDVLGCAQTGTGKTAAFALPLLDRLSRAAVDKAARGPRRARALVLSPTRELAAQIGESFAAYGRETALSHTVIFGGVSQYHQARALSRGVDIIVATPGRLIDLMEQRIADLSGVETLVLDEADRMLDMGFIEPIRQIAAAIKAKGERQTLLFSATMPKAVMHLAQSLLHEPVKVAVTPVSSAAPLIEQGVFMVRRQSKQRLLEHLLREGRIARAVVFTRTKHGADKVGWKLSKAGIRAEIIHGNKAQNYRKRALSRFSTGAAQVLVATDVAARGLDVEGITHVFNFDLPVEPEAYVHRIGRTGRAGATGIALSFCDAEERGTLRDIERLTGKKIAVRDLPELPPEAAREPEVVESEERFETPRPQARQNGDNAGKPRATFTKHSSLDHPKQGHSMQGYAVQGQAKQGHRKQGPSAATPSRRKPQGGGRHFSKPGKPGGKKWHTGPRKQARR